MTKEFKVRNLMVKKPFYRILPYGRTESRTTNDITSSAYYEGKLSYCIVTQADFMRELDPMGHKINDEKYYRNKVKYDETEKKYYIERVIRASFPFQNMILCQQIIHACGNDIHHELAGMNDDEDTNDIFTAFKEGWYTKEMDVAFFDFVYGSKSTGDSAMVFFLRDGVLGVKVLSYADGDTLYPDFDPMTGELVHFVRKYEGYDAEGNVTGEFADVWDKKYIYHFKQSLTGLEGVVSSVKEMFGLEGYVLMSEPERHMFPEVPVVYHRERNGACWSLVQDSIDKFELAVSYLCQNNMAYAFPIMVFKGDDIDIKGDMDGSVKSIAIDKEGDVSYLTNPQNTDSYRLQLEILLKQIFMGSFIVMPPELKSGDISGIAIKMVYSPSLEKAMVDEKEYHHDIQKMTRLFQYGYGIEKSMLIRMTELNILSWLVPYIHESTAELINNLVQSTGAEILSKQTASEHTGYAKNNEMQRLLREKKQEQEADLLFNLKKQSAADTGTDTSASTASDDNAGGGSRQ